MQLINDIEDAKYHQSGVRGPSWSNHHRRKQLKQSITHELNAYSLTGSLVIQINSDYF